MNFYHCEIVQGGLESLRIESRMPTKLGCCLMFDFGWRGNESIRPPICRGWPTILELT